MDKIRTFLNNILKLAVRFVRNPRRVFLLVIIFARQGPVGVTNKLKQLILLQGLDDQYQHWFKQHYPSGKVIKDQQRLSKRLGYRPLISILVPTFNPPIDYLRSCLDSVLAQSYDNWQLCIADDASTDSNVRTLIKKYAQKDARIDYIFRKKNGHICAATNSALDLAKGEFIGLLDHDDILWPNALFEVVSLLNKQKDADLIYSDEDKLELDGRHTGPFFKPDWSPDYLRSINVITHFAVARRSVVEQVGRFRAGVEGAQDWDLFLRMSRATSKIHHIPTVLYSWRKTVTSTASQKHAAKAKPYTVTSTIKALNDDLKARRLAGSVTETNFPGTFHVQYKIKDTSKVSIIIPTKNCYDYLKRCLDSITEKTTYPNYEIILVDTGSTDQHVLDLYRNLTSVYPFQEYPPPSSSPLSTRGRKRENTSKQISSPWSQGEVRWGSESSAFNFSATCNFGAKLASGSYLVFLNNDTEVLTPNWLEGLLEHAQRDWVGAVGAKLLYPNQTIQHLGGLLGVPSDEQFVGIAGHAYQYQLRDFLHHDNQSVKNYSFVTAACLMIDRKKFMAIKGFDEKLAIAWNDVDLGLRLSRNGLYNVVTPFVELLHHESISVGKPDTKARDARQLKKETKLFLDRWDDLRLQDPFLNPNFSKRSGNFDRLST